MGCELRVDASVLTPTRCVVGHDMGQGKDGGRGSARPGKGFPESWEEGGCRCHLTPSPSEDFVTRKRKKKNGNSAVTLHFTCHVGATRWVEPWKVGARGAVGQLLRPAPYQQPNIMPPPTSICFFPERGRGTPVGRGTLMGRIMKLAEEHDVLPTEMTLLPQRERQD